MVERDGQPTAERRGDGVVYVATGEKFRDEAARSLATLREHSPDLAVCVFTDEAGRGSAIWNECDHAVVIDDPDFSYFDKIRPLLRRPFERTLYLDTDTWVRRPLEPLFDVLDVADVAAANEVFQGCILVDVPDVFPEPNTGVFLLGNDHEVDQVIHSWAAHATWMTADEKVLLARTRQAGFMKSRPDAKLELHDQPSFRQAVWEAQKDGRIRYATLPPEVNLHVCHPGLVRAGTQPWIIHTHWKRGDEIGELIEAKDTVRVWVPGLDAGTTGPMTNALVVGGSWGRRVERVLDATNGVRRVIQAVRRR